MCQKKVCVGVTVLVICQFFGSVNSKSLQSHFYQPLKIQGFHHGNIRPLALPTGQSGGVHFRPVRLPGTYPVNFLAVLPVKRAPQPPPTKNVFTPTVGGFPQLFPRAQTIPRRQVTLSEPWGTQIPILKSPVRGFHQRALSNRRDRTDRHNRTMEKSSRGGFPPEHQFRQVLFDRSSVSGNQKLRGRGPVVPLSLGPAKQRQESVRLPIDMLLVAPPRQRSIVLGRGKL